MIVNEQQWAEGNAVTSSENKEAVKAAFENVGKAGMDLKEIAKQSGLKWPYGAVKALVEDGFLERKQFGRRYAYRVK
jgi:hypothetical protein